MLTLTRTRITSPIGDIQVEAYERGVKSVCFLEPAAAHQDLPTENRHAIDCIKQLVAYFEGKSQLFNTFALAMLGTDFQQSVWEAAMQVPFGQTASYKEIAEEIGSPDAARAVGNALNANPLLLIVPCHRIVPASGGFGEFAAGAWRKEWLLNFEKKGI